MDHCPACWPELYRSNEDLAQQANRILTSTGQSNAIPVPIERIVDVEFGITIEPTPAKFMEATGGAYPTTNCNGILVGEKLYESESRGFKMHLATCFGHILLHGESLLRLRRETAESQEEAIMPLYGPLGVLLERQAWRFAAMLLVPGRALSRKRDEHSQVFEGAMQGDPVQQKAFVKVVEGAFDVPNAVARWRIAREWGERCVLHVPERNWKRCA